MGATVALSPAISKLIVPITTLTTPLTIFLMPSPSLRTFPVASPTNTCHQPPKICLMPSSVSEKPCLICPSVASAPLLTSSQCWWISTTAVATAATAPATAAATVAGTPRITAPTAAIATPSTISDSCSHESRCATSQRIAYRQHRTAHERADACK